MNNFFDWDTAIFATVLAGYILAGVFVERWMDPKREYEPPKREPYTGYRAEPNVPTVVIPEGVTELDSRAFHSFDKLFEESCHDLQHLVIPSSVTKIAPGTFTHLDNLIQVEVSPDNPAYEVRGGHIVEKLTGLLVATTAAGVGIIPE